MLPYLHITLSSYAVMAFIGGFSALIILFFRIEKYSISFSELIKYFVIGTFGGFAGSKLLFAMTQIPWLVENFTLENLLMLIPQSGYVYYGGLLGVLISLQIATLKDKEKRSRVFKLIVPAIPLFHGFGRIGCMMAGCCYGVAVENHIIIGFLEFDRVPVQLIEALFEFLLFFIICIMEKKKSRFYSINIYLIAYAIFRFVIEFYRGDSIRGVWLLGFSTSQYISVIIVIMISYKFLRKWYKTKSNYAFY